MKYADIQKLHEGGWISADQRQAILEHFDLHEQTHRFLTVILWIGAVLVSAGITLVVSANWREIPNMAKIVAGILLLVGAYRGGWWLREESRAYPRAGEALYIVGSLLFLANIALLGQIYHLSSRLPNAFLVWLAGIAPLPWILRSRSLQWVSLSALLIWFGSECWATHGWLMFGQGGYPFMLVALLGLLVYALGIELRPSRWALFSPDMERFGLLVFTAGFFPFTVGPFHTDALRHFDRGSYFPFPIFAILGLAVLARALSRDSRLPSDWRWVWGGAFAVLVSYLGGVLLFESTQNAPGSYSSDPSSPLAWIGTVLFAAFALVQVRVGIQQGSSSLINLGITLVALVIVTTYLTLIGSMGRTGLVFILSGLFLIVFGIYLEKQRRQLLERIRVRQA